jgi:squalene synthase HpnC
MDERDSGDDDPRAVLERIAARSAGQMGAENFPVALRLLPRRPRTQLTRVYGYARFVDDIGDEAPGDRGHLLDLIEQDVRALPTGGSRFAAVSALLPLIEECAVPLQPLLDLVEANRLDQRQSRYQTFEQLLGYCQLSAAPVGQLVLYVAGAATEPNIAASDQVCNGLQVLEHCQDVGEDARAGRVYLPATELSAARVDDDQLYAGATAPALRRVIATQVDRAVELLDPGRALVRRLSGWARVAVSGYVAGGLATATALRRADYDVLARAVRPSRAYTAALAIRLLASRGPRWTT